MEIEAVGPTAANELARLRAAWHAGEADDAFIAAVRAWLEDEGPRRATWLASVDGAAVGMVSRLEYRRMPSPGRSPTRWGYVGNLFVLSDHRRRGVASALVTAVVADAEARGYGHLLTAPSAMAEELFAAHGFLPASDSVLRRAG